MESFRRNRFYRILIWTAICATVTIHAQPNAAITGWETEFEKGKALFKSNDISGAVPALESAFKKAKEIFPTNDRHIADAGLELGALYKYIGQFDKALPAWQTVLEITEKNHGRNSIDYAEKWNNIAILYSETGRFRDALPIMTECLSIVEKSAGKPHFLYGSIQQDLAALYNQIGEYDKGLAVGLESLGHAEKYLGKNHLEYGLRQSVISELYRRKGQFQAALPLAESAAANVKSNLGENHPTYAEMLINLAGIHQTLMHFNEAIAINDQALSITEKSIGKENDTYGYILTQIASIYRALGNYEKALPYYKESLSILEKTHGTQFPGYGVRLSGIALLYSQLNRNEEALALFNQALSILQNSIGPDHPETISALHNLAGFYNDQKEFDKSLPLLEQARTLSEMKLGKMHPLSGTIMGSLSIAYLNTGQLEKARPLLEEGLNIISTTLGKNHYLYGSKIAMMGKLNQLDGDLKTALENYTEANAIVQKIFPPEHADYARSFNNLGTVNWKMGNEETAIQNFTIANKSLLLQLDSAFRYSSEKEKKDFLASLGSNFDRYLQINMSSGGKFRELQENCLNNQILLKGLLLNSTKDMLSELAGKDIETDARIQNFRASRAILSRQYSLPIEQRKINLDSLRTEVNAQDAALTAIYNKRFPGRNLAIMDWKTVRDKLSKDQAAIEFSHFTAIGKERDSIYYVAFVMRKDTQNPQMITLFEEQQLLDVLKQSNRGSKAEKAGQIAKNGAALYELIWKPLEKSLSGTKTVFYAPDGLLYQLPFSAMKVNSQSDLASKYDLVRLSSTTVITKSITEPALSETLLLGGVTYDYQPKNVAKDAQVVAFRSTEMLKISRANRGPDETWDYLPGTLEEVKDIGDIFSKKHRSFEVIQGSAASEEAFKKMSGNSPAIIHLSTHGFFFENIKHKKKRDAETNPYVKAEDPLIRSGLILAGANEAWMNGTNPYEKEDGILTSLEISNLDLSKTDMVVLSACDTGLGDIDGSEGVYGLQRAFKMAGVKIIIMSLWQVPDVETAEFMKLFYSNWLDGKTVREAFTKAQKEMSKKYDVVKWAGFVLVE